jgi:hypothetical protein
MAVRAWVGKAFVQPGHEPCPAPTVGLRKTVCGLAPCVRVRPRLSSRERAQGLQAGINASGSRSRRGQAVRVSVDAQAQRPARGPLDATSACDPVWGKVLGLQAHLAYPWTVATLPSGRWEGSRPRKARERSAVACEPWLLRQLLGAAWPCGVRRVQHAWQRMTRHRELCAMIGQQSVEGFLAVSDAVLGISFTLADSPSPHAGHRPEPVWPGLCWCAGASELELSRHPLTRASDVRCTASPLRVEPHHQWRHSMRASPGEEVAR